LLTHALLNNSVSVSKWFTFHLPRPAKRKPRRMSPELFRRVADSKV
jgi:hypothetical protein